MTLAITSIFMATIHAVPHNFRHDAYFDLKKVWIPWLGGADTVVSIGIAGLESSTGKPQDRPRARRRQGCARTRAAGRRRQRRQVDARIWDVTDGRCRCALRVTGPLVGIAWHPDGTALAAAGVHLFSYLPGRQLRPGAQPRQRRRLSGV
ncbi:hypothetical protein [Frankia sp. AgB32]|uniref:hypothetical protein n=1 Tax=Frankia sp. AgB32 TaxID=631119 RepID=UPI00200D9CCA|nr:hypothetical protein [Frankia sp. AgB32]MCK9893640.1 hypothetical protein [Frankia sp. AgB32]